MKSVKRGDSQKEGRVIVNTGLEYDTIKPKNITDVAVSRVPENGHCFIKLTFSSKIGGDLFKIMLHYSNLLIIIYFENLKTVLWCLSILFAIYTGLLNCKLSHRQQSCVCIQWKT